ncbi:hypothetical protein [Pseudomonas putida]|uniref:hypothetical protein n=1 Tax=Pseudomonas putida TaxID=303 RepID=UPI001F521B1F|nr:hypothetical protein [Pseudomonas putida]MCI0914662.1 hypothetical protein [Pseudomonas putida]
MATQHDLYADSAQALDRRLSGEQEVHWAEGITPQQAAANNRAWLAMIRKQDKNQKASSRTAIASALDKMEAMSGTGAARRTA